MRVLRTAAGLCALALPTACASAGPGTDSAGGATAAARPHASDLLAAVSPARIRADVDRLTAFGTRHTLSAIEGERGIGAARKWILARFAQIAVESGRTGADAASLRLEGYVQPAVAPRIPRETGIMNVECVLPGRSPRRVYLVAHYDSRATDPLDATSDAPGANDDGSGVAALLEAARVLAPRRFGATIVLLAVAGEEQGLFGSKHHAAALRAAGTEVTAVLSDDIVGDPSGPEGASARDAIRVFSEGLPRAASPEEGKRVGALGGESDSPSRELARYVAEVADLERTRVRPRLVFRPDRFLRGGDHLSFQEQGFAAVRFTDVFEKYDRQHQDVREEGGRRFGDVPEFVDAEYLADVTRLNVAVLAHLADAPAPPRDARIVTAELTTDTTLRWSPSADADVAGYEVVWRATTSAVWEHARDAGTATQLTLPICKDDWLFGVRAYGREGLRGLVAFPGAAKE